MEIEMSGLRLRDWQLGDLAHYAHWLQPGHAWKRLDAPYYAGPTAVEIPHLVDQLRQQIEANRWPSPRHRLAIAHKTDNRLMGMVSRYWQSEPTDWLSVGLVLYDPADWGQGFGAEALGHWSDYLFREMPQLRRLDLRTWSGNKGMMRLAEKLGYQQEACFRQARIVDGVVYDGLGYGVLRSEWVARYPNGF